MGVVNAVFRDVVDTCDCSLCESPAGENCNDMGRNPRLIGVPHTDRFQEYVDLVGGLQKFKVRVAATGPARKPRGEVMIVVCKCGQKNRLKNLAAIDKLVCGKCKAQLAPEANRQAIRNANIVLELAAVLANKNERAWTKEEDVIARIVHAHEVTT